MSERISAHLKNQLRIELEGSCVKSGLGSFILAAIYQFAMHKHFADNDAHIVLSVLLIITLFARISMVAFKSVSDQFWLNVHSFVVLSNSVLWTMLLLNIEFSDLKIIEVHLTSTLLFVGLIAAASFSLSISKRDFFLFTTPLVLGQVAVTLFNHYDITFQITSILIASLFFAFLGIQRRRVEENWVSVRKLNFELQNIVDAVPGGISVLRNGKYTIVNKYVKDFLPAEVDVIGLPFGAVMGKDHGFSKKIIEFTHSSEKRTQFEVQLPLSGEMRSHIITASKTSANEIIISATDMHDLKKVQEKLVHSARMASLGEMSGGLSHEINNPVTIISMRAQQMQIAIRRESATPEKMMASLNTIIGTADRIARIAKGLRNFSQDNGQIENTPAKLKSIVEDSLAFCFEKFRSAKVNFSMEIAENLEINCNSSQLSQVILNALSNSFDAVRNQPEKWIRVQAREENEFVSITITDSGCGISPEIRDKVMQPFFSTKEVGNTGLGLSIAKGIIESHEGQIFFNYTENGPTELKIILPSLKKQMTG